MSPTLLIEKGFRFFFFSREESRKHIHVVSQDGEAKFWLEPTIEVAMSKKLSDKQLNEIQKIIEEHNGEFTVAWQKHLGG